VKEYLYEENPNFDQEKMEHHLDQFYAKVNTLNEDFSHFNGEFMGISETVLNKNILCFKLDRATKQK
jgi:hypothetical protein